MAEAASKQKPILLPKRLSGVKALELILAETDSEDDVGSGSGSESDENVMPDAPTSEVEDNVEAVSDVSTDDEESEEVSVDQITANTCLQKQLSLLPAKEDISLHLLSLQLFLQCHKVLNVRPVLFFFVGGPKCCCCCCCSSPK